MNAQVYTIGIYHETRGLVQHIATFYQPFAWMHKLAATLDRQRRAAGTLQPEYYIAFE